MRLDEARIAPTRDEEWDDEQRRVLASHIERGSVLNIFRTMAVKPKALERFLTWGSYILGRSNSLPARERELAILRTGWNCRSGYEWTQHVPIGIRAGLSDAEIEGIKHGADAGGWAQGDVAILNAVDDLTGDFHISDASWTALSTHFSREQCMDLVYTVGQYTQVSMALNSFGVQLDPGQTLDKDFPR
ncbi:carboxymuconolactone decarboxylase family protein [Sphingomonas sp. R647]|uniref:carboxymuconolactone decarboxylase family protein n=1 Tax=Sphingomonas sp. R647 TaxID=2875233 RepID=UPI001CD22F37|nr:carboxymuconolactone decarboxylase family protein [Sphingomonas sp. R647]MCA1200084.1 carboxymuconolactone decarboxylase family protein [Sphingomonas sp. R647]